MRTTISRSICHIVTISVVALMIMIGAGGVYLADTMMPSTVSSFSIVTHTSCSPFPCPSTSNFERMTTINGSTFMVISGTTTENITCVVAVPPPQGIYLRVINDSGSPISALQVTVQSTPNASCNQNGARVSDSFAVTNSSGWTMFQGWIYFFVFTHSGGTYNFTVPSDPMAWTIATISVPSGTLTTEICGLGGGSPTSSCQAAIITAVSSVKQPG